MDPSRVATEIINALSSLSGPTAYATIVGILLICGLGIPIPEDITLLAAGLLASTGQISLFGALMAGLGGVLLGDAFLFFMGRRFGKRIFALPGFRRLFTEDRVQAAEDRIRRNGPFICFIARFLPGLRSPVFAMAGALGVKPRTFVLLDGFAAAISVPLWVHLGYWFGNNFDQALQQAKHLQIYILAAVGALIALYLLYRFWKRKTLIARETSLAPGVSELKNRE